MRYKLFSGVYDLLDVLYFNRKHSSPRTALIDMIPEDPVRVLDVCAGTGSNSLIIAQHKSTAQITALDLSEDMLKIAEGKFKEAGTGNVKTLVANAIKTGLGDKSFDVILLSLVLHEINEDTRISILSEAKRLLNDGGIIIVVEWEQPKGLWKRFMFSLIKLMEPKGFKAFLQTDLSRYFDKHGLVTLEKKSCDYTQVLILKRSNNGENHEKRN